MRLFQSLGIFNRNIHTVSSFHVYLDKLYQIEKNKESITSGNFVISRDLDQDIAIKFNEVDFKYLGSDKFLFQNTNIGINDEKNISFTNNFYGTINDFTVLSSYFSFSEFKIVFVFFNSVIRQ